MNKLLRNSVLTLFLATAFNALATNQPANYFLKNQDAYFNHQIDLSYVDPYRNSMRTGADFENILIEGVKLAKKRVWLAVLDFDLSNFATKLAELKKSGIDVRVIVDSQYNINYSNISALNIAGYDEYLLGKINAQIAFVDSNQDGVLNQSELMKKDALSILKSAGVPVIDDTNDGSVGSGLMHHKFVVIDDKMTIVTSANFTRSDIHGDYGSKSSVGNANALIYFKSPGILKSFEEEFSLMWGAGSQSSAFGLKKFYRSVRTHSSDQGSTTIQFSPTSQAALWELSVNGLIGKEIATAKKSVLMDLFVFSEQRLTNILEPLHDRGVEIEVLIDRGFATRYYSELLDMWGLSRLGISPTSRKCFMERDNRVWSNPIKRGGIPALDQDDKLHHKFAVIDERKVIFGSQNWSAAANNINDETLMVVNDQNIAAKFVQEHKRLMQKSYLGPGSYLLPTIQAEKDDCADGRYDASKLEIEEPDYLN